MKRSLFLFILIFCCINVNAFVIKKPNNDSCLVAIKDNNTYIYKNGGSIKIWLSNKKKFKGRIYKITNDSVALRSLYKKKNFETITIAINQIKAINKINIKSRYFNYILLGSNTLLSIIAAWLLLNQRVVNNPSGALLGSIVLIPLSALWVVLEYSFLINSIIEQLTKKTAKRGWRFSVK